MGSSAQPNHTFVYPQLPTPLDPSTIKSLFSARIKELEWAKSVTHAGDTRVWILTLLKSFEFLGYFPKPDDIPVAVLQHVAESCGLNMPSSRTVEHRTLYRQHRRIRNYLDVSPWGNRGRHLIQNKMEELARVRSNPADLINAAIECLVCARIELPALSTLRRLAGNVNEQVQNEQLADVHSRLTAEQCVKLDELLIVNESATTSPFDQLCESTGAVNRKNVARLVERLRSLEFPTNLPFLLAGIAMSRYSSGPMKHSA